MLTEMDYKKELQSTFSKIERAFSSVDPDLVECECSLGSLTLTLFDQSRCILSGQTPVRQLWLAIAGQGIAYHFNLDPSTHHWVELRGKKIELMSFLKNYFKTCVGLELDL